MKKNWYQLSQNYSFTNSELAELLDGGQSFVWYHDATQHIWTGFIKNSLIHLKRSPENNLAFSYSNTTEPLKEIQTNIEDYLGRFDDFITAQDELPWRSDAILRAAIQSFPNLRILKQDPDLTLLSFLCSSNKRIAQIKDMIHLLSKNFGTKIEENYFKPPSLSELADCTLDDFKTCKLGYRAKYILSVAKHLKENPGFHTEIMNLSYDKAKEKLLTLNGVGEKVADCVLLFGYQKMEAFPVDTWILKAMEDLYNLKGWNKTQIIHFAKIHFGKNAGLAQQFLFSYIRSIS